MSNPPEGIRFLPHDDDSLAEIHVELIGPEGTPYAGGFFEMKLLLTEGFPTVPPKGIFLTKIFHPNIASNGEICVNTLKRDWSADLDISHVLQVIRCLLIVPFPESSLNDEAGKLFMDSYDEYARRARILTSIHATKQKSREATADKSEHHNAPVISSAHLLTLATKRVSSEVDDSTTRKKIAKKKSLQRL